MKRQPSNKFGLPVLVNTDSPEFLAELTGLPVEEVIAALAELERDGLILPPDWQ